VLIYITYLQGRIYGAFVPAPSPIGMKKIVLIFNVKKLFMLKLEKHLEIYT